jgi:hypothetical protein
METKTYYAYNKTRESFLSLEVTVVDTALDPLKAFRVLIEGLASNAETGLWLTPLTGIPMMPRISPFDLIFLDKDYRVTQGLELLPGAELAPLTGQSASALVLPSHSISSSQTLPGDQLIFCAAEEPARIPVSTASAPASQITESPAESLPSHRGFATLAADDQSSEPQPPSRRLDEKENTESTAPTPATSSAESLLEQYPNVSGFAEFLTGERTRELQASTQPLEEMKAIESVVPAPAARSAESLLELFPGLSGFDNLVSDHHAEEPQAAAQQLDEKEKPESTPSAAATQSTEPLVTRSCSKSLVAPLPDDCSKLLLAATSRSVEKESAESQDREKLPLKTWFVHWLYADRERRRAPRHPSPGLVAYRSVDQASQALRIGDISSTGIYLVTGERWSSGALIGLTLQTEDAPANGCARTVAVQTGAVRWGKDGVGLSFVLPTARDLRLWESMPQEGIEETEPEYILKEIRTARALAFLRRICPLAAEEVWVLFRERLSNFRVASAVRIALKAEELLAYRPDADRVLAHADLVVRILEYGSWADADWIQNLWAGLLATSCTAEGQDESNLVFVDLLNQLTPIHFRILAAACARATEVMSGRGMISSYPLYCTAEEMIKATGSTNLTKIHRSIAQLSDLGLLAKSVRSSFISYTEKAKTTPTSLGLQMYARCSGLR